MVYRLCIFVIFLGSVFLTCGKFVETENAIKFYFTILAVFIAVFVFSLQSNNIKHEIKKVGVLPVLKGMFLIGVMQAGYGILQYIGKFPSNHNAFVITGSFENPAGFVAVLSLLSAIGIYWCINSKGLLERCLIFFSTALMLVAIVLSGSRSGILATIISSFFILSSEYSLLQKFKRSTHSRLILISVIAIILLGSTGLYKWREDSANGRLLVWKVTAGMIGDKPLLGFGYKGFQAHYMDYQAHYFTKHPQSQYQQLANNIKHPFNPHCS
jgi:O-antigen polymerase